MEVVAGLAILWIIVTLVGHGTWVLVRSIFRTINDQPPETQLPSEREKSDIAASLRIVSRLLEKGLIDRQEAADMWSRLRALQFGQTNVSIEPKPLPTRTDSPVGDATEESPIVAELCDETEPVSPSTTTAPTGHVEPFILAAPSASTPAPAPPTATTAPPVAPTAPVARVPQAPVLSRAEIIQSFLAAHNIRWGELVAGLLIVVCSIGLVISLWSTLVARHRVIPSFIFLGANAAIYAAGLYTLSRWRLRHTSRAVLVIATLLVPLSVLAGLAAAGTNVATAVQLNDLVTVLGIVAAGTIYSCLLWFGGRALTGTCAQEVALAVAGPVFVLPFLPAAVRTFGDQAGWAVVIGSVAILAAVIRMIRRHRATGTLGMVGSRNRLLVMSFGGFALAVLIGYTAFTLRDFDRIANLPVAISIIPAFVALAAAGRSLMASSRRATQSMVGAVVCASLIGLGYVMLPPAMAEAHWLWSWAIVFSAHGMLVGWLLHQPRWFPLSTLPVGLATVVWSPAWHSELPWDSIPLWSRLIGGQPMLAATLVAAVVSMIAILIGDKQRQRWMAYAASFWIGVSMISAGLLAIGNEAWLGPLVPWWSVTAVLVAGAVASIYLASRQQHWSGLTIAATSLAWCSIHRPLAPPPLHAMIQPPDTWMVTAISISVTLMLLREITPRIKPLVKPAMIRAASHFQTAAVVTALFAAGIASLSISRDWQMSASMLAAAAGVLFWASTSARSIALVRSAQLTSAVCAIVIGYGRYHDVLIDVEAWTSGQAMWGWAIVASLVTAIWFAIRELANIKWPPLRRRLHFLLRPDSAPIEAVDGYTVMAAAGMVMLASTWSYSVMLANAAGLERTFGDSGLALPLVAFSVATGVVSWMHRHRREPLQQGTAPHDRSALSAWVNDPCGLLLIAVGLSAVLWVAIQVATVVELDASGKLVVATSIAMAACIAIRIFVTKSSRFFSTTGARALPVLTGGVLALLASTVLLTWGWLDPITSGERATMLPTVSVATWWLTAATCLLWLAWKEENTLFANVSHGLVPAAVALLVPAFTDVHPATWVQYAAIASMAWAIVTLLITNRSKTPWLAAAIRGSLTWSGATGIASTILVTGRILFGASDLDIFCGPASFVVSLAAIAWWLTGRLPIDRLSRLHWPIALTILSGQFAWLAETLSWIKVDAGPETVLSIGCIASVASLAFYAHDVIWKTAPSETETPNVQTGRVERWHFDFWHAAFIGISLLTFSFLIVSDWMTWIGIIAAVTSGLLVAVTGFNTTAGPALLWCNRAMGWIVVAIGGIVLIKLWGPNQPETVQWTMLILWAAAWVIGWRAWTGDIRGRWGTSAIAIPDVELSILLLGASSVELALSLVDTDAFILAGPNGWLRIAAYALVGVSTCWRAGRNVVWTPAIGILLTAAALCSLRVAATYQTDLPQQIVIVSLTAAFVFTLATHGMSQIATVSNAMARLRNRNASTVSTGRLVRAGVQVAFALALIFIGLSAAMIANATNPSTTHLMILSVGLVALAIAELAETSRTEALRHAAVSLGLITIALLASVETGETGHPWLVASMRWLVASVVTIPTLLLVLPKLLGSTIAARWTSAFKQGAGVSAAVAAASLVVMLAIEATVRTPQGIADVSRPMVIGVAVTLAILSLLAGLITILSGPKSERSPDTISGFGALSEISPNHRRLLILATQAVAGLTWLHLFLCKTGWAFIGLRSYWPYLVMGMAFVSVGATEWARRRGDKILSETLSQTALYLPLIPVVGFWLSGSLAEFSWAFAGGRVRYDLLLALGAIYYVGLSAMWKQAVPRVAAVVLGNAALWVVLVQREDWSFLSHPQAWLIPPAVCVLITAHLYRDRLQSATLSAIRYASTLAIYISSTADMLLQQIGTNLGGPIILIVLALLGMLAGVILQVRSFLYLGAAFVFVGATSMVWHAQRSFDAVWPWWVFGITTGVCLLAALMALEKNKDKLRRYAQTLATWQG